MVPNKELLQTIKDEFKQKILCSKHKKKLFFSWVMKKFSFGDMNYKINFSHFSEQFKFITKFEITKNIFFDLSVK